MGQKPPENERETDLCAWNEAGVNQAHEDADACAVFRSRFILG
jgi:hypothetical protein